MIHKDKNNSASILTINLNELVHSFIREFSMACKKASIYGSSHPSTKRAIEKPFHLFDEFYQFKKYLNLNIHQGQLYCLNIRLKDSIFNEEIIRYMQILDIKSILFEKQMTLVELDKFINRFVKRVDLTNHANVLSSYLKSENINSIEVNTELSYQFFDENKQYRGDVSHDFSIQNIIMQQLPDNIESLAKLYQGDPVYAESLMLDYDIDLLVRLIPEKVTSLSIKSIDNHVTEHIQKVVALKNNDEQNQEVSTCKSICRLLEFHPEYEAITKKIESVLSCENISPEFVDDLKSPTAKLKMETVKNIDTLMSETFSDLSIEFEFGRFLDTFERLLKTRQKEKAAEVAVSLVNFLGDLNYDFRQKALTLLVEVIKPLNLLSDSYLFDKLSQVLLRNLFERKETFEYSEFIWQLIKKTLHEKDYASLSKIMHGLHLRLRIENNVTIYDSIAIKKVYMNFNQKEIINGLIDELLKGNSRTSQSIKDILIAVGSEEVAMALSNIISHPERQVRQQALRILGELGHASLEVFTRILIDDEMFKRESGRQELPDEQWYVIRNSIFVFGLLKDRKACIPLRMRINDHDVRVRREIISSLEKIGGEESVDILMMMVDDENREIREAAVITIGLIGNPEIAPLLISLVELNQKVAIKAVNALGKIGGEEAKQFLNDLMDDKERFDKIAYGEISREDLRLAVVKALGILGDTGAINTLKQYQDNLTRTQKILFKNSPVNKALKDILSKK